MALQGEGYFSTSLHYFIGVLILLCVSSYCCICVLILLYVCLHTLQGEGYFSTSLHAALAQVRTYLLYWYKSTCLLVQKYKY
jgi:hypothetical protein